MRRYTVTWEGSISAAQDLISLKAPATISVCVLRLGIGQSGAVTSEQARVVAQRASTQNTTGATALTPRLLETGDPAAGTTAYTQPTSPNTLTGDALLDRAFNWVTGDEWVPAPEERIWIPGGGFLVYRLTAAPSVGKTVSVFAVIGEVG